MIPNTKKKSKNKLISKELKEKNEVCKQCFDLGGDFFIVYLFGDIHGGIDISKLNTKNFPEQKHLTRDDYVIILGDFGLVWDESKEILYWLRWLGNKPFTVLFIDGNHENFDLLNQYPVVDYLGGKAHKVSENIYHLMRGEIFTTDGNKYFCMGGAESVDKENRQDHIFITKEEAKTFSHKVAATVINGNEYFATLEQLENSDFYIIDPNGIESLLETMPDTKFEVIYVMADENIRKSRYMQRGESEEGFLDRNTDEISQFNDFEIRMTIPNGLPINVSNIFVIKNNSWETFSESFVYMYFYEHIRRNAKHIKD